MHEKQIIYTVSYLYVTLSLASSAHAYPHITPASTQMHSFDYY